MLAEWDAVSVVNRITVEAPNVFIGIRHAVARPKRIIEG